MWFVLGFATGAVWMLIVFVTASLMRNPAEFR